MGQLLATNWSRHSCAPPCPGSLPAARPKNSFQLGLRLAELIIHHFQNELYFREAEWGGRVSPTEAQMEKMQISEGGGWGEAHILILRFITRHNCIFWLVHPFLPLLWLTNPPPSPCHRGLELEKEPCKEIKITAVVLPRQVLGVIPPKKKKKKKLCGRRSVRKKNNFTYYQERSLFIPGSYQFVAEDGGFLIVAQRWTPHQDGKESFPCNPLKFKGTVGPVLEANSLFFSYSSLFFFFFKLRADTLLRYKHESK